MALKADEAVQGAQAAKGMIRVSTVRDTCTWMITRAISRTGRGGGRGAANHELFSLHHKCVGYKRACSRCRHIKVHCRIGEH